MVMEDRIRLGVQGESKCIAVYGPPGVGKTRLVDSALAKCRLTGPDSALGELELCATDSSKVLTEFRFDPVGLDGFLEGLEADSVFRDWAESVLTNSSSCNLPTLVIDDAHLWFSEKKLAFLGVQEYQQYIRLVLVFSDILMSIRDGQRRGKIVIIFDDSAKLHPWIIRLVDLWIFVDIPSPSERLLAWKDSLKDQGLHSLETEREDLAAINSFCHGWVYSDIVFVTRQVILEKSSQHKLNVKTLKEHVKNHEPTLFRRGERGHGQCPWTFIPSQEVKTTWNSIGGLESTKQALKEVVVWPLLYADKLAELGLKNLPAGVVLYGPPGTGKTLLASAAARESNANFLSVSISDIIRGHVGESEKLLAQVFAMARRVVPCILFFDEFQALFGRRDGDGSVGQKLVTQFLLETSRSTPGLMLLATTNIPEAIDPALLRPGRFDRRIFVPLPDDSGRRQILQNMCKEMNSWEDDIDLEKLVDLTFGYSGAEIEVVCHRAGMFAIEYGESKVEFERFLQVLESFSDS